MTANFIACCRRCFRLDISFVWQNNFFYQQFIHIKKMEKCGRYHYILWWLWIFRQKQKMFKDNENNFFFLHRSNVLSLRYDIILCRLLLSQKAKILTTVSWWSQTLFFIRIRQEKQVACRIYLIIIKSLERCLKTN